MMVSRLLPYQVNGDDMARFSLLERGRLGLKINRVLFYDTPQRLRQAKEELLS